MASQSRRIHCGGDLSLSGQSDGGWSGTSMVRSLVTPAGFGQEQFRLAAPDRRTAGAGSAAMAERHPSERASEVGCAREPGHMRRRLAASESYLGRAFPDQTGDMKLVGPAVRLIKRAMAASAAPPSWPLNGWTLINGTATTKRKRSRVRPRWDKSGLSPLLPTPEPGGQQKRLARPLIAELTPARLSARRAPSAPWSQSGSPSAMRLSSLARAPGLCPATKRTASATSSAVRNSLSLISS